MRAAPVFPTESYVATVLTFTTATATTETHSIFDTTDSIIAAAETFETSAISATVLRV